MGESDYALATETAGTASFANRVLDLIDCANWGQIRPPTPQDLEAWMLGTDGSPPLTEAIAEQWLRHRQPGLAAGLIKSLPPSQRSPTGWITLAQAEAAEIDLNQPLDEVGREAARASLQAWQQALDAGAPVLPYFQLKMAALNAWIGEADTAVALSEQALAQVLQSGGPAQWSAAQQAGHLYQAAEVYVALDQRQLASAYMDQAESLVADDAQQLQRLAGRRRWVEQQLPIFLGMARP